MRLLILLVILPTLAWSQTSPRFAKYPIGDSGFSIYLPSIPHDNTASWSPDSSRVYTIESSDISTGTPFRFSAIVINLKDKSGMSEELVLSYLEYLKQSYKVISSAGVGKGHELSTHSSAKGLVDFWKSEDGTEWQVVSWYDAECIVVQFVYGDKKLENESVWQVFKNGIRFPGDK